VSDQAQGDAKPGWGEEASVLLVGELPDLTEYLRVQPGLLEELDGDLSGDHPDALGVCLSEELAVDSFLFRAEVQVRGTYGKGECVSPSFSVASATLAVRVSQLRLAHARRIGVGRVSPASALLLSAIVKCGGSAAEVFVGIYYSPVAVFRGDDGKAADGAVRSQLEIWG
jgi:hypothetical protein